jgi:hypothetical protein
VDSHTLAIGSMVDGQPSFKSKNASFSEQARESFFVTIDCQADSGEYRRAGDQQAQGKSFG